MAYSPIDKSSLHFKTHLYTGNGSTNAQTGVGFQPDWVWIKQSNGSSDHQLYDVVRGTTKYLRAESNDGNGTAATGLTAFGADGFTSGSNGGTNGNNETYCSWNWKAGTGQGSSNTNGSINTTYTSVNTTSGFSISQYNGNGSSGATIGHGLGVVPKVIIVKRIDSNGYSWAYGQTDLASNWSKNLHLNENGAVETSTTIWNDTAPTNQVFSVGNNTKVNASGGTYIAYCFAEKTGYSKFGIYKGNGNSDGVFVYTGFKPAWLMLKRTNSAENWHIFDVKRNPTYPTSSSYAGMATRLMANLSNASDLSQGGFRFLSNGLKMTTSWSGGNGSGDTFIYMCFGQSLVGSNDVPCTAR